MFDELNKDAAKGVPLYVQIREEIRKKIENNELTIGSFLPAETDLAAMFRVSRMTVRNAIDDLVQEGLVIRKHGTGTIIASKKTERDYSRLTSFYEDMKARGLNPTSKVLKKEIIPASDKLASKLQIHPGDMIFHILRLRFVEKNKIITLHELHIPQALCPWLKDADLGNSSLYAFYEANNVAVKWGRQIVEASIAPKKIADYLDIEPNEPILFTKTILYTGNNIPLEYTVGWNRSDRYALNLILKR